MALHALTLFKSVLPLQRSWSAARSRALAAARRLLASITRRIERLLAPLTPPAAAPRQERGFDPPALPGHPAAEPVEAAPPMQVTRVAGTDFLDPGWLDGLLGRVRHTRSHRDREAAVRATLADLERLIPALESTGLGTDGLLRSYRQMKALHDPDRDSTGFELNMAWVLLERELRTALSACRA